MSDETDLADEVERLPYMAPFRITDSAKSMIVDALRSYDKISAVIAERDSFQHSYKLLDERREELQKMLSAMTAERDAALEKLEQIEIQGVDSSVPGWVCVPSVEWISIFEEKP